MYSLRVSDIKNVIARTEDPDAAISLLYPKPPPSAHIRHPATSLGLGRPEKGHMHDWDFCLP